MTKFFALLSVSLFVVSNVAFAGTFTPQVSPTGVISPGVDAAIPATSPKFVEWADNVVSITRGPEDIANPSLGLASFGNPSQALGPSNAGAINGGSSGNIVSLGDGGSIVVSFLNPIKNGPGPDFAVFENGFLSGNSGLAFLELATVAVSSDDVNFYTFPAVSATATNSQVGPNGLLDASNLYDLAGKYIAGYGTPFDLSELEGIPGLDLNGVKYVKITDVVGDTSLPYATHDSNGNAINDPWPTPTASSGFDLDAVGVLNAVPEPGGNLLALFAVATIMSFLGIKRQCAT